MKKPVVTLHNGQPVMAVVIEKESSVSSSPFGATMNPPRTAYMYGEDGLIKHESQMMKRPSTMSQETINEELVSVVDGIPAGKAEAIKDSISASYAIIDVDNTYEYEVTDADIEEIKGMYEGMIQQLDALKSGAGGNADNKLAKYEFKKHLLIQGEKGGGKTYMVSKLLEDRADEFASVDIRGHEGMEAIDLLGYYIKTDSGGLVWKDGPLTSAFRSAASGTKTILSIDEMLRIPKRELNILVGALSPNSSGEFKLDTNQAEDIEIDDDGHAIAKTETLVVKKDMLWCIGTTNAGAGYAVDTIDEALADRFRTIIKRVGEKEMKKILEKTAKDYGHDKSTVTKLMKFYKGFNALKDSGELTKLLNLRHLAEILEFSENNDIAEAAEDLIPTLTTMDQHGYPNETQQAIIEGLIEKELAA